MKNHQGQDLIYQDKLQAALEFYENLLQINENDSEAFREKVFCLVFLDKSSEAHKLIDKLKETLPNDFKVKYLEIKLIIQLGDLPSGKKGMKQLQSFENNENCEKENNSWNLMVRGKLAHIIKNDFKASLQLFEKSYNVIEKKEKYLVAQEIGTLYYDTYQIEDEEILQAQLGISKKECLIHAINWFKRVGEDNPHQGKGYLIISQIYLNQGNLEKSEIYCKKAFDFETSKPVAYVQLACIVMKRESNLQKTLDLLKEAHSILKSYQNNDEKQVIEPEIELLIYQAKTLGDKGYFKESIQILEYSLKIHPNNPYIYLELGHILFSNSEENIKQAVEYYQKCYEIDPKFNDPAPAIALGSFYLTEIQQLQELEEENERFESESDLKELDQDEAEEENKSQKDEKLKKQKIKKITKKKQNFVRQRKKVKKIKKKKMKIIYKNQMSQIIKTEIFIRKQNLLLKST